MEKHVRVALGLVIALVMVSSVASTIDKESNVYSLCSQIINVKVSELTIGEERQVEWCRYGVRIVRRSEVTVEKLRHNGKVLQDEFSERSVRPPQMKCTNCLTNSDYTKTYHRSRDTKYFVSLNHSPYLGCYLSYFPKGEEYFWPNGNLVPLGNNWQGGYYDPCHELKYDEAGRAFNGRRVSQNLFVPPYKVEDNGSITIGSE